MIISASRMREKMSANITDIMHEIESYGMPKERVAECVATLIVVGQQSLLARLGELAGADSVSEAHLELIAANLVALSQMGGSRAA